MGLNFLLAGRELKLPTYIKLHEDKSKSVYLRSIFTAFDRSLVSVEIDFFNSRKFNSRKQVYVYGEGRYYGRENATFRKGSVLTLGNRDFSKNPMPDDLAKLVADSLEERKLTEAFCYDVGFPLRFFESLRDSLKGGINWKEV